MFCGCNVQPDSKETKLGSNDQEASPSASKNTGIVLVPFHAWKCVPTAISGGVDISEIPGVLREGHKNFFKNWCFRNSQLTFLFLKYF